MKELLAGRQHLKDEVRGIVNEAKALTVENEFKAFHKRRDEQQEEYQRNQALARMQQQ